MVFRWAVVIFGGIYDHLVSNRFTCMHQIPLADHSDRGKSAVVFNQSSMGQRLLYDSFQ